MDGDKSPKYIRFFRSYFEAAQAFSVSQRKDFYFAIIEYFYTGIVPQLSGPLNAMFQLAKPNIDTSKSRSISGEKGGKQKVISMQAKNMANPQAKQ